ncbi:protein mono-ADP-ribosyltransferase PARP12-like isoform X2 [Hyla sarda]|uniref:protein mono-ADP-ribosyltransferase PARP12-like isoform X2 n=1 Tax=Hyla sarda TaxID=327740 RepID=UPI0024C445EA|nr:protein mono-ADP-ribosyltransferase PARP12-like isoform X2 [Hyla sarda]
MRPAGSEGRRSESAGDYTGSSSHRESGGRSMPRKSKRHHRLPAAKDDEIPAKMRKSPGAPPHPMPVSFSSCGTNDHWTTATPANATLGSSSHRESGGRTMPRKSKRHHRLPAAKEDEKPAKMLKSPGAPPHPMPVSFSSSGTNDHWTTATPANVTLGSSSQMESSGRSMPRKSKRHHRLPAVKEDEKPAKMLKSPGAPPHPMPVSFFSSSGTNDHWSSIQSTGPSTTPVTTATPANATPGSSSHRESGGRSMPRKSKTAKDDEKPTKMFIIEMLKPQGAGTWSSTQTILPGTSSLVLDDKPTIYTIKEMKLPDVPAGPSSSITGPSTPPVTTATPANATPDPDKVPKICLCNLWKQCKLEGQCPDVHYYLPYRWQIYEGTNWEDISNMEEIEKCYCDPSVDSVQSIDFVTMRSGVHPVRRLSTVSSVTKPPGYVLTTEWLWYWKNENCAWTPYGHSNVITASDATLSSDLENVYLAFPNAAVKSMKGKNRFEINFSEMKQKNICFRTEKDLRRRPKYLNFEDVKLLRGSTKASAPPPQKSAPPPLKTEPPPPGSAHFSLVSMLFSLNTAPPPLKTAPPPLKTAPFSLKTAPPPLKTAPFSLKTAPPPLNTAPPPLKTEIYPRTWDASALPEIGCQKVRVSRMSREFSEIVSSFTKTVSGYMVRKLWRLQNPSLWQVFQWQKEQMKKINQGQKVNEKRLFHSTEDKNIDAICYQNFDWRLCGAHGNRYGEGSYFARDASYSHEFSTLLSGLQFKKIRMMFVARVLVGDYTTGNPLMKRPPEKPGNSLRYYDSCVDNMYNPSIFVVFEKHQVYPEYLLEYF